jgi:hypothetical protein
LAVFRVEKTKDYTVMANHHLRNTLLSLKAKGLLSLMLSLPENWDYTTKGLSCICKDGIDSINATVKELEEQGYVVRRRIRNEKGQLTSIEYTILEQPQHLDTRESQPKRETQSWISQHWIIQHWDTLYWKNLNWVNLYW